MSEQAPPKRVIILDADNPTDDRQGTQDAPSGRNPGRLVLGNVGMSDSWWGGGVSLGCGHWSFGRGRSDFCPVDLGAE